MKVPDFSSLRDGFMKGQKAKKITLCKKLQTSQKFCGERGHTFAKK
jgi:hypothetical protein